MISVRLQADTGHTPIISIQTFQTASATVFLPRYITAFELHPQSGFFVMAAPAKGLPVLFIPEQRRVAAMRDDMIDHSRRGQHAVPAAFRAKRVLTQEQRSGLAPAGVVPASVRPAAQRVMAVLLAVLLAIHTALAQIRAAGIPAGSFRF